MTVIPDPAPFLIGEWADTPPACDGLHLAATYHPHDDKTWCWCGEMTWDGYVPTLRARAIYDHHGRGAKLIGWDCYWLEAS